MNIKILKNKVLILPDEVENVTKSGLILSLKGKDEEHPTNGTVVTVGGDKDLILKVGDKVIFNKYSGTTIEVEGKNYVILKESDVLCIINN
jgi:chaperonin GroES